MLKINSNKGGSVSLKIDETLTTNEVFTLKNVSTGLGIEASHLNGDASTSLLRSDVDTSTTGIITSPNRPYLRADMEARTASTSNFLPDLYLQSNVGFTLVQTTARIYPLKAGTYYVQAQQLIRTTSVTMYMQLRKNGTTVINHGYSNSVSTHDDIRCSAIVDLVVGDYVDIYYSGTLVYSWGGAHSCVICYLVN